MIMGCVCPHCDCYEMEDDICCWCSADPVFDLDDDFDEFYCDTEDVVDWDCVDHHCPCYEAGVDICCICDAEPEYPEIEDEEEGD